MPDDQGLKDNGATLAGANGYRCLITGAGTMGIAKYTNGLNVGTLGTQATTSMGFPITVTGQVIVSPTQIAMKRNDVGPTTLTVTDSTYRGGYFQMAMNGTTGQCTRIAVS